MTPFTISRNNYLSQDVQAFYHTDFGGVGSPNNPNYLYKIKNDPHHNWSDDWIRQAQRQLLQVLQADLPAVYKSLGHRELVVCVVPRAKAENTYRQNQLLFKATVSNAVNNLGGGLIDGTNFIQRHTNTKTTHLRNPIDGFDNDGPNPYVGITNDTCNISNNVKSKNVLLIDDIYTRTINIDEDAIQALLTKGANSVSFYAIGKTVWNN